MADDDLLSRLGAVARELEAERDPALDRLVAGAATDAERRALTERAGDDPALRDDLKRLEPVGDAVRQRIVERARFELAASPARSRARWLVPASLAAAAAAALLLLRGPSGAPLPDYALAVSGGIDTVRGDEARELVLAPDTPLDLVLRPARDVTGAVALRAFFRDEPAQALALASDVSAQGALRVHGRARDLFGVRNGERELVLVACRPARCDAAVQAAATDALKGEGWQAAHVRLTFTP